MYRKTKKQDEIPKMNEFQTLITLVKGMIGTCVMFTPKAFANGGYIFAPFNMMMGGFLTALCAVKLIHVAQAKCQYNYSELVEEILGPTGRKLLELNIFVVQYSFSISGTFLMVTMLRDLSCQF